MSIRPAALQALNSAALSDPVAVVRAAAEGLKQGLAAPVERVLVAALDRTPQDRRLWQFLGLARRELQDSAGAHAAFAKAAALAPADPLIAHSLARTALEAGYPAVPLFNRARQLAPGDGAVALGRIAALCANDEGGLACAQLAHLLKENPAWLDGHIAFGGFAAQEQADLPIDATLRHALAAHPKSGPLWQTLIQLWMSARDYDQTLQAVHDARAALGADPELDRLEAICLSELGEPVAAQALFDLLPSPSDAERACFQIRNLIRLARIEDALRVAEQDFEAADMGTIWPYRALLWRLTNDPRWHWLEGHPSFIRTFDLTAELGPVDALAAVLRKLHKKQGQPLDQSVRGGSQTDGNLLARAEPEVRRLRAAILDAAHQYQAGLPPPDPHHPLLAPNREDLQIAGAWSVRLTAKGFHADHVHQQGWLSSAFYVAVPNTEPTDPPESGWLTFGECRDLLPNFEAFQTIEPKVGVIAIFPSTLWHGTRPFGMGERLTVATDIARPRSS